MHNMKQYNSKTLLSIGLILLTSCAVGPNYKAPEMQMPEAYSTNLTTEDKQISDKTEEQWWKSFNDEILFKLLCTALEENKTVKQAINRIDQSRALYRVSTSDLYPGAIVQSAVEKSEVTGARFPGGDSSEGFTYKVYSGSIDALWEIDLFGRLRREVESRKADFSASLAKFEDLQRMLLSEVALEYFNLRALQAELQILEKNIDNQMQLVNLARNKLNLGVASELDVLQSGIELRSARATIPTVKANITVSKNRLAILLGKFPDELKETLSDVQAIPVSQNIPEIRNPEELLKNRPDIKAAERNLAAANAQIGVATAERFPKITFEGSFGIESTTFKDWADGEQTFRFGPRLSWAIIDLGRIRSQIKVQEARTRELLNVYEETVLKAFEDVENSLTRYSAELQRIAELEAAYKDAQRGYEIAQAQYNEGISDILLALEAQRTLLNSENQLNKSKQALSSNLVGVYKALGGSW